MTSQGTCNEKHMFHYLLSFPKRSYKPCFGQCVVPMYDASCVDVAQTLEEMPSASDGCRLWDACAKGVSQPSGRPWFPKTELPDRNPHGRARHEQISWLSVLCITVQDVQHAQTCRPSNAHPEHFKYSEYWTLGRNTVSMSQHPWISFRQFSATLIPNITGLACSLYFSYFMFYA